MDTWNIEPPKESGYYLATWKYLSKSRRVSEFWFDGLNWWTARAYVQRVDVGISSIQDGSCVTELVIAWMPKPKPYRKEHQ